jgi:hypothetical protein
MRIAAMLLAAGIALTAFTKNTAAAVTAHVDISAQTIYVYVNGALQHVWPVSTARMGYRTPVQIWRLADAALHLFPRRLRDPWVL